MGAQSSLIRNDEDYEPFHGIDGFGVIYSESEKPSKELIQKEHAVDAMRKLIDEVKIISKFMFMNNSSYFYFLNSITYIKNAGDITLIAIGPLTNIALLYKLNPGISSKISRLYIMGGNYRGVGNITSCAEFNFWSDPEAAHIVFDESLCEIYVFPWETCLDSAVPMNFHDFRIDILSSNKNPFTQLLDPVEIKAYVGKLGYWSPCDCYLASCFIAPNIIKDMNKYHVSVELSGNHSRGQMVIDRLKKKQPNTFVIESIYIEKFIDFIKWVCYYDIPTSKFL